VASRKQYQSASGFRFIHIVITIPCLNILNAKTSQQAFGGTKEETPARLLQEEHARYSPALTAPSL
jgi:hypothetical protein